jgi:TolB-like protein
LEEEFVIKGVQYVVDGRGKPRAVVIDLSKNRKLWEDFYDRALTDSRRAEPRESLESVKLRLANRRRPRRCHA